MNYEYDELGRTTQVKQPDNSLTTLVYNGLITRTTNALGQTMTEVSTPRGKKVRVNDAKGGRVRHVYDSIGNLKTTRVIAADESGNDKTVITRFQYDRRGRKIKMIDPDMGTWTYHYNAVGEMTLQVDAKGQATVSGYDDLGRMVSRKTADEDSTWTYHPVTADETNRGRLQKVSSTMNDHLGVSNVLTKEYTYNEYGQPVFTHEQLPGMNAAASPHHYSTQKSYDGYGRLQSLAYLQRDQTMLPVIINYNYSPTLGHLESMSDQLSGVKHWEFAGAGADGKLSKEKLGDTVSRTHEYDIQRMPLTTFSSSQSAGLLQNMSYRFDSVGNLKYREDHLQQAKETFDYDELNRLTQTLTTYTTNGQELSLTSTNAYDGHGNLRSKDNHTYLYGDDSTTQTGSVHQLTQRTQGGTVTDSLAYDANGNMTHAGQQRTIQWNTFNKPSHISKIEDSGFEQTVSYLYNTGHQRVVQRMKFNATWYYDGGMVEHYQHHVTNKETYKYFLVANGQKIGYIVQSGEEDDIIISQRSTTETAAAASIPAALARTTYSLKAYYLLNDHLGSPQVVVDSNGQALENLSFSAWGERRAANFDPNGTVPHFQTLLDNYALTHGFTGHEQDDFFGLINISTVVSSPELISPS